MCFQAPSSTFQADPVRYVRHRTGYATTVSATVIGASLRDIYPLPSDDSAFERLLAALDRIPDTRSWSSARAAA